MLQAASGSLQNHLRGDFGTHVSCHRVPEGHAEVQSGLLAVGMALLGLPVTGQGVGFCSRAANAQEEPSSPRCQLSAQRYPIPSLLFRASACIFAGHGERGPG